MKSDRPKPNEITFNSKCSQKCLLGENNTFRTRLYALEEHVGLFMYKQNEFQFISSIWRSNISITIKCDPQIIHEEFEASLIFGNHYSVQQSLIPVGNWHIVDTLLTRGAQKRRTKITFLNWTNCFQCVVILKSEIHCKKHYSFWLEIDDKSTFRKIEFQTQELAQTFRSLNIR